MRMIKKLVNQLDDELKGAENYAEKYLETKANGSKNKEMYFNMAKDELTHAMNIHTITVEEIEKMRKVYAPPADMMEKWNKAHELYIEKVASIKSMLSI